MPNLFALVACSDRDSLSLLQTSAEVKGHAHASGAASRIVVVEDDCKEATADMKSKKAALKAAREEAKNARAAAKAAKAAAKAAKAAQKAAKEAFITSKARKTDACPVKPPKAGATPVTELPTKCRDTRGHGGAGRPMANNMADPMQADETCASGTWVKGRAVGRLHTVLAKNGKNPKSAAKCADAANADVLCTVDPGYPYGAADFVNYWADEGKCECGWNSDGWAGGLPSFTCYNSDWPHAGADAYSCGFAGISRGKDGVVVNNPVR